VNETISINRDQVTLEDAWGHYQTIRDSIVRTAGDTKRSISRDGGVSDPRFRGMTADEVEAVFYQTLEETDRQASLFLVASAEAVLSVDFLRRVKTRKKDPVSREFREIYKNTKTRRRLRLDEDILATWAKRVPGAKPSIAELRGALNYRHWLAHGRYWVPKLGRQYDPAGLLKVIADLFEAIGLSNQI